MKRVTPFNAQDLKVAGDAVTLINSYFNGIELVAAIVGVAAVVAFSVPNIGQTGMLIYAYVSYILLSTAYTVVNIPMASILPALSEDPHERTVLASCRTFFSSVGSTVVSAFALTLVDKFGNGNEALGCLLYTSDAADD